VRLLDRYLLRQLVTPLLFAFVSLTGFLLLNQIARRFGDLAGKGLPWTVIGQVFLLCVPFLVAMTLPMAILVAVLYALSHLAADNEITAMRASGVSIAQILSPLLLAGCLLSILNFAFSDQVLPRTNVALRSLLISSQEADAGNPRTDHQRTGRDQHLPARQPGGRPDRPDARSRDLRSGGL
jgi:lipopolysaccharide export system permease protein